MVTADLKRYDPDDHQTETFATWDEAAQWLLDQQKYGANFNAWINDESVSIVRGRVVKTADIPPFTPKEGGVSMSLADAQFDRIFRAGPSRPTNPATFRSLLGEDL